MATATQRRSRDSNTLTKEPKSDREDSRAIRARQRAIGRELRRHYDNVAKEPVPDEFIELLRKIDESGEVKATK